MQQPSIPYSVRTAIGLAVTITIALLLMSACQSNIPPGPTAIPSETLTITPSPSLTGSVTPIATLAPLITATGLEATARPVAIAASPTDTPGPYCYVAKQGDTLLSLISRAGYANADVLPEVRRLNNLCDSCNGVQAGQTYCVPRQTLTPSPQGLELTRTFVPPEVTALVSRGPVITYPVVEGDTITIVVLKTHATLREICELNNPDPVNCGGCKLDNPVGQWQCRPTLRVGAQIKIYGPTLTPTITPTLSGSETATPTPMYAAPRLDTPAQNSTVTGPVQLVWLPVGVLHPDEFYLVLVSDVTAQTPAREFEATAESYQLPADMMPKDNQPHTINWRVIVSRKTPDGTYIQVGRESLIYTFTWKAN
jgi:hypothetical protein